MVTASSGSVQVARCRADLRIPGVGRMSVVNTATRRTRGCSKPLTPSATLTLVNDDRVEINGAALRHVRSLTGRSLSAVAREVGITPTFMSFLERGLRRSCRAEVFAAINAALGITDDRVLMARPRDLQAA